MLRTESEVGSEWKSVCSWQGEGSQAGAAPRPVTPLPSLRLVNSMEACDAGQPRPREGMPDSAWRGGTASHRPKAWEFGRKTGGSPGGRGQRDFYSEEMTRGKPPCVRQEGAESLGGLCQAPDLQAFQTDQ